jgi:hypothetical protein
MLLVGNQVLLKTFGTTPPTYKTLPYPEYEPGTFAQWKNISITSMEVDFWGVKSSGCENSHATELKCSNIPQKN